MSEMAELGQEFGEYVVQLTAQLVVGKQPQSMSEMERGTREMLLKLGQFLMGAWLGMQEEQDPPQQITCACGRQAEYQFRREGTLLTIVGQVKYRRAYYVCETCREGCYPLDDKLGLRPGEMSAELESLVHLGLNRP